MLLDNCLGECQTQPGAVYRIVGVAHRSTAAEQVLKHTWQLLFRNAWTVVLDADRNLIIVPSHRDLNKPPGIGVLDGVAEQIAHD